MINSKALILILIMAGVTMFIRFLPFLVFNKKETPEIINFLGKYLPYSIIGMLVIYCLKDISLLNKPYGIPELAGVLIVGLLHIWKRNTLLSIVAGTICYMILKQTLFI